MTSTNPASSGVTFDWLVVREIQFLDASGEATIPVLKDVPTKLDVRANLRGDKRGVRVSIAADFNLPKGADGMDGPRLLVRMEGQFTLQGDVAIDMEGFARQQAPVIMLPFLREAVATISGKTRTGQILLNPLNLGSVIAEATAAQSDGAKA